VIPRSMIISVLLNGVFGIAILIAALFCLGDVRTALNSATRFPYMEIFVEATGSAGAASAMVRTIIPFFNRRYLLCKSAILIAAFASATMGYLTTASRMTWAFARERGLPGSEILSRVG
jgi:choline transport protein